MATTLTQNQQAAFNRQIGQMKEDGFFLPAQRALTGNTRYLVVSYGGTGAAALFGVKKQFEAILPKAQLEERVRFLAIDTDQNTKNSTKKIKNADGTETAQVVDSLSMDQFILISGSHARLLLEDDQVAEWINPKMKETIKNTPDMLTGTGASGYRQVGRLSLFPKVNYEKIIAKVQQLVRELTNDNIHPLRVFILTGIAGGTGSGTVIDLTYLIRDALERLPGQVGKSPRSKYSGFILLPPTGDSTDINAISHGNRNGYAALKEINYFMNITAREGEYQMTYEGGNTVTSHNNIFDSCYLLDGTADGVAFGNPREKAIQVLAESLLDMICATHVDDSNQNVQTVDSFMNDLRMMQMQMISGKSIKDAMRDADYTYCALGHSEFAMPIHEIKAYVAKKMFDKIYNLFLNCGNVEKEDVEDLLKNTLRKGAKTGSSTVRAMNEELEIWFTNPRGGKGGPYFTINLLRDLVDEIRNQRNKLRGFRIGMASNDELDNIEKYALHVNNTTFNVYTAAMEALKTMMDDQFGVVVTAGTSGNTYSFIPESMGAIGNTEHVIRYLDGLINNGSLHQLTEAMLREMIDNREAWTALARSDDPTAGPRAMRRFWNEQLDKIITSTLEDFLIKYYSGNPDAYYSLENYNQTYTYLQQAANAIYNEMLGTGGKAQPMAGFTGRGLQPGDFNGHTYLMVPECAPNLLKELKRIAAGAPAGAQVKVCTSLSSDRISCYKQYTSIPAFKLKWACDAESDYEKDIATLTGIGTHMSETAGGNQWKTFPNLLPMSCWSILPNPKYDNPRERALAERAVSLFDRAHKLQLTTAMLSVAGIQALDYSVKVLSAEYRPDDALFRDLDRCVRGSEQEKQKLKAIDAKAEELAAKLFEQVSAWTTDTQIPADLADAGVNFEKRNLAFTDSILTVGPGDKEPEGWNEYMAKCMFRKLPNVMNEVNGTVMVMEKLKAKVSKATQAKTLITLFGHYLITDMFSYNEDAMMWQYTDENEFPKDLVFISNEMERACELYFMFDAFRNDPMPIIEMLAEKLNSIVPAPGCTDKVKKVQAFMTAAKVWMAKMEAWNKKPPIAPYIAIMTQIGHDVKAIKAFYLALYNEFKTMAVAGYIPVIIAKPDEDLDASSGKNNYLF